MVEAVRAKPWIHGIAKVPGEGTYERWVSPQRGVFAWRRPGEYGVPRLPPERKLQLRSADEDRFPPAGE